MVNTVKYNAQFRLFGIMMLNEMISVIRIKPEIYPYSKHFRVMSTMYNAYKVSFTVHILHHRNQ
jgi:hypothetical protein